MKVFWSSPGCTGSANDGSFPKLDIFLAKPVLNESDTKSLVIFFVVIVHMRIINYFIPECPVARTLIAFEPFTPRLNTQAGCGWTGF